MIQPGYWIEMTLSGAEDLICSTRSITRRAKSNRALACGELSPSRTAGLPSSPNLRVELNATQEIHTELARRLLCPAPREDINLVVAMRANKVAHVFDHPGDIDFHLPEHLNGLAGILK